MYNSLARRVIPLWRNHVVLTQVRGRAALCEKPVVYHKLDATGFPHTGERHLESIAVARLGPTH